MTPSHALAVALSLLTHANVASMEAPAASIVAAARDRSVSSCDVAALVVDTGRDAASLARDLAALHRRCGTRGLALAAMRSPRGDCRDVAARGWASRVLGVSARLCATAAEVGP